MAQEKRKSCRYRNCYRTFLASSRNGNAEHCCDEHAYLAKLERNKAYYAASSMAKRILKGESILKILFDQFGSTIINKEIPQLMGINWETSTGSTIIDSIPITCIGHYGYFRISQNQIKIYKI